VLRLLNAKTVERVVIIVVNALHEPDSSWGQKAKTPGGVQMILDGVTGLVNNAMFETGALLHECIRELRPRHQVSFQLIEVSVDQIQEDDEREFFESLPMSLTLPAKTVDLLSQKAAQLLADSPAYQRLVAEMHGAVNPITQR